MLFYKRPYPIFKDELLVVKKYINEYFDKEFIYFSISLAAICHEVRYRVLQHSIIRLGM